MQCMHTAKYACFGGALMSNVNIHSHLFRLLFFYFSSRSVYDWLENAETLTTLRVGNKAMMAVVVVVQLITVEQMHRLFFLKKVDQMFLKSPYPDSTIRKACMHHACLHFFLLWCLNRRSWVREVAVARYRCIALILLSFTRIHIF